MPEPRTAAPPRLDPRTLRSRRALREALAAEIEATGDLSRVTVTAVTDRAGLTRRTFYSHYRDIADLVAQTEEETLGDLRGLVTAISNINLEDLYHTIDCLEPCPGAVEFLEYFKSNGSYLRALLGDGGDPAFIEKIKALAHEVIGIRALTGIDVRALGSFFDYYITFAISAEAGVLTRWLAGGMRESTQVMARIMTVLMFVRPGDLYGNPIDLNIPAYGLALMNNAEEYKDVD
ncbi:MAG: TetR family transcriptional regulator C-terminal domain-containing protein [Atopobiaceae bacterium]|jgi:AcrR family transcriptional regulator|nr:TetR family transcriptional regulator C-terminal domain-containing protein [Atopobiaceae bacterium]